MGVFFVNSQQDADMLKRSNRKVEVQNMGTVGWRNHIDDLSTTTIGVSSTAQYHGQPGVVPSTVTGRGFATTFQSNNENNRVKGQVTSLDT